MLIIVWKIDPLFVFLVQSETLWIIQGDILSEAISKILIKSSKEVLHSLLFKNTISDTKNSSHVHSVDITLISVSVKQELPATAFIDYDRMCCELKM